MHIPSKVQHSFYYELKAHCDNAIMTTSDGRVHHLHGVVINKLCNCKQGVEVRLHATEAKLDGNQEEFSTIIHPTT